MIWIKRILTVFVIVCSLHISTGVLHVYAQGGSVGLVINGQPLHNLPSAPIIDRDRVLVPARVVFENLGATVNWYEDIRTVHVQYQAKDVRLTIGDSNIIVNNYPIEIPVPAQIINNHTMIPVGAVSTNLGFLVDFRDSTVFVDSSDDLRPPIIDEDLFPGIASPYTPPVLNEADEDTEENDDEDVSSDSQTQNVTEQVPIVPTPVPTLNGNLLNLRYSHTDNILFIPRTSGSPLMNQVSHNNMYRNHRYALSLNVDASQLLDAGRINVANSLLSSIDITHTASGTELVFNGTQILALHVGGNDAYYMIHVMCPRQRYRRIVIIDPGHGGDFPGAVYDDIRAADLNLAVAGKLVELIERDGHMRAFTTRDTDETVFWAARYTMGNNIGDLMITIHHNAAYNLAVHGVEAFYITDQHDANRSLTNQRLAEIVQTNLAAQTGRHSRGIRSENFIVLRYTTIPSALVEVGFMSNEAEFATLTNPAYQWRAAQGLYNALLEAFMYVDVR